MPGVFTVGTPALTPHERACAAILACGPTAMLAGASAMVLNGIWHRWEEPFEITITDGDRRPKGVIVHRSRTMHANDIKRQYGIPVTSPARTFYDIDRPIMHDRIGGDTVDAHWPDARLIAELDGWMYHNTEYDPAAACCANRPWALVS